jgi:hypothetical protein
MDALRLYRVKSSVVEFHYTTLHRKCYMALVTTAANSSGCSLFGKAIKYLTCRVIAKRTTPCLKQQTAGTTIHWQFYHSLSTAVTYFGDPGLYRVHVALVQEPVYI